MEERLKPLMKDLGNAINESLSGSERIAEAIEAIKEAGYDVFLVLELTIGFNKREADDHQSSKKAPKRSTALTVTKPLKFTTQDERFLKGMRIGVED